MSQTNLNVIVVVEALPSHTDELKSALRRLADATRQEPGCLAYAVMVDNAIPTRMVITETWSDADALVAHRESAHVAAAVGAMQGKLAAAPEIRELTSFA